MWKELRPFQQRGVLFGLEHRGRLLLADEMGLGKTVQVRASLQLHGVWHNVMRGVLFGLEHRGRLLLADETGLGETVQYWQACQL